MDFGHNAGCTHHRIVGICLGLYAHFWYRDACLNQPSSQSGDKGGYGCGVTWGIDGDVIGSRLSDDLEEGDFLKGVDIAGIDLGWADFAEKSGPVIGKNVSEGFPLFGSNALGIVHSGRFMCWYCRLIAKKATDDQWAEDASSTCFIQSQDAHP